MTDFTEETIERLFGADVAEDETKERFLQYFYFNRTYDSLRSNPIRILVGHKGVGKSALLRRSYLADLEDDRPAFWLRPNDLISIRTAVEGMNDFIRRIEGWKEGIARELTKRFADFAYKDGIFAGHCPARNPCMLDVCACSEPIAFLKRPLTPPPHSASCPAPAAAPAPPSKTARYNSASLSQ